MSVESGCGRRGSRRPLFFSLIVGKTTPDPLLFHPTPSNRPPPTDPLQPTPSSSSSDFIAHKQTAIGPLPPGRFPPVWQNAVASMRFACLSGDRVWHAETVAFGMPLAGVAHADPQLRMALEVAGEALHDAGIPAADIASGDASVGVFAATGLPEHVARLVSGRGAFAKPTIMGNYACYLANLVSQALGLTGPSLTLDTACSSSITALHVAMESLASGSCDAALVIATNALLSPHFLRTLGENGALSTRGTSLPFDAAADGFVRGEGAVAMVLVAGDAGALRVARVPRASCRVYADILVTGINHDGRETNPTEPSAKAQTALVRRSLARARVGAAHVALMEAHATGTPAGDPIEAAAVSEALGGRPGGRPRCPWARSKATLATWRARRGSCRWPKPRSRSTTASRCPCCSAAPSTRASTWTASTCAW